MICDSNCTQNSRKWEVISLKKLNILFFLISENKDIENWSKNKDVENLLQVSLLKINMKWD